MIPDDLPEFAEEALRAISVIAAAATGMLVVADLYLLEFREAAGDLARLCRIGAVWFGCRAATDLIGRWRDRAIAAVREGKRGRG